MSCVTKTSCRLCPGELRTLLELAPTPPANALVHKDALCLHTSMPEVQEKFFPLGLAQCVQCGHVQNPHVVDPELLFTDDYAYVSGTSAVFRQHLSELARSVSSKLYPEDLIVEVGSNDGTLLSSFMTGRKLGVDPARKLAEKATKAGVLTYPGFLTPETAHAIVQAAGKARRVLALNVMAHVDDLRSMVEAIWGLLTDDGELVMEVAYLPDMLEQGYFDQIYSEHLSFHHLAPLVPFFASVGLTLYDAEHITPQGGSIRCYVSKARREKTDRILALLADEKTRVTDEAFRKFRARIETNKTALRETLAAIKAQGKRIAAFGCPAKATTLLHEFGIGRETIGFIVEENPGKVGRLSPGKHVPIVSPIHLGVNPPDYMLCLAWNFADDIIRRYARTFRGSWILPMPEVRVVEP